MRRWRRRGRCRIRRQQRREAVQGLPGQIANLVGQVPHRAVGMGEQCREPWRGRRVLEVVLGQEQVFAHGFVELRPQTRVGGHGLERQEDDPGREAVHCGVEVVAAAGWRLVVAVAALRSALTGQRGHVHAVVVHQPQRAVLGHQEIAVLQVAVGDAVEGEIGDQLGEPVGDTVDGPAVAMMVVEPGREGDAVDPLHLEYREPFAADPDGVRQVLEAHLPGLGEGRRGQRLELPADGLVARLLVGHVAGEAFHRVAAAGGVVGEGEDAGEVPRDRPWLAELRQFGDGIL